MISLISILVYGALSEISFMRIIFLVCLGLISLIHFSVARIGFSEENASLVIIFWCLSAILPIFVGFGYWEIGFNKLISNITDISIVNATSPEWDVRTYTIVFFLSSAALVVLRICSIIQSVVVYVHFGEGLKNLEYIKNAQMKRTQEDEEVRWREEGEEGLTFGDVFKNTSHMDR